MNGTLIWGGYTGLTFVKFLVYNKSVYITGSSLDCWMLKILGVVVL
jgi:hypothetical protein